MSGPVSTGSSRGSPSRALYVADVAVFTLASVASGLSSGVLSTLRQTGSALGGAIVLAVLQARLAAAAGAGATGGGMDTGTRVVQESGFVSALHAAITVPVAALLIGAALCLALKKPRAPGIDSDTRLFRIDSAGAGGATGPADSAAPGTQTSPDSS